MATTPKALEDTYVRAAKETSEQLKSIRTLLEAAEGAPDMLTMKRLVSEALDQLDGVQAMAAMAAGITLSQGSS